MKIDSPASNDVTKVGRDSIGPHRCSVCKTSECYAESHLGAHRANGSVPQVQSPL